MASEPDAGSFNEASSLQRRTLIDSIKRYWWLVLLIVVVFVGLGVLLGMSQDEHYAATADVIIEDPRARVLFSITDGAGPTNQASERYLADQVEILRSADVAIAASESLGEDYTPEDVVLATTVAGELTSNLIEVTFRADTPEDAKRGADAVVDAYIDVQQDRIQNTASTAVEALDVLILEVGERLDGIQVQIAILTDGGEDRQELDRQLAAAQAELNAARIARDAAPLGSEFRAQLNARIDELLRDFAAWDTILRIEQPDAELAALIAERESAVAEQATLVTRRNSVAVDAKAATAGVVLVSPASVPEEPEGLPIEFIAVGAAALGLALATAIAYGLSLRRTILTDRNQPELLLAAPMVGDIPPPRQGESGSALPIVYRPDASTAEAFRFIATAISGQQERAVAAGTEPARVIAVASAATCDGRTMVTVNTAIAVAQDGYRVLVIDADFERQGASSVLAPNRSPAAGLTEVLDMEAEPTEAVMQINEIDGSDLDLRGHGTVGLLSRGEEGSSASFLFKQSSLSTMLDDLTRMYDLVLIDCAPLLEVAYAGSVVNHADGALAVVRHGESLEAIREFREQLDLTRVPIVGYVYDRSSISLNVE